MLYSFKFWDLHDAPLANRLTKKTEVIKRRMLYYSSKLIADQAPKGKRREWNYAITEVYVIVLMDGFELPNEGDNKTFSFFALFVNFSLSSDVCSY